MSKRSLFVSFAESDGGHSYLAARAMLNPSTVGHLVFRNTVSESLEAVASGQANCAVVPSYNTITQWEGATIKALASGAFEICGQVCMPTSYVLVAHKDYMNEFVNSFSALTNQAVPPSPEEQAKIYTRFLSKIFVGPHADQQYRGRFTRPDMIHASIELSRNPLRVLEELTRSELMKALSSVPGRGGLGGIPPLPQNVSGGMINIGATPYGMPAAPAPVAAPVMEILQAPAALVAEGLLNAPGDPEGWDQPGSLGEIVALLRKLLVLLNVYSFGSPDLPENQTQYLLIKKRGDKWDVAPDKFLNPQVPSSAKRIMMMVKTEAKHSSADLWLKPRAYLSDQVSRFDYVLDRAPLTVQAGKDTVYLIEGGKPKGSKPKKAEPAKPASLWHRPKPSSVKEAIEKKPTGLTKDDPTAKSSRMYLGEYQSWCHDLGNTNCWCCSEAHPASDDKKDGWFKTWLAWVGENLPIIAGATLISVTVLALVLVPAYCAMSGSCSLFDGPGYEPPTITQPPQTQPSTTLPVQPPASNGPDGTASDLPPPKTVTPPPTPPVQSPYPGVKTSPAAPTSAYPGVTQSPAAPPVTSPAYPGIRDPGIRDPRTTEKPVARNTPKYVPAKPVVFHAAFFEAKSNLTRETLNALTAAAGQAVQLNKPVNIRIVALGARETDENLWRRRLYAVKDELVRLGVPFDRIRSEGAGPFIVMIKPNEPPRPRSARQRLTYDLDSIDDPLSNN